jgi:N-acyl homoserine lactone hydrolase
MKVEQFIGGWFTAPAGIWRRGDSLDEKVRFPIPVYVIETEQERILVDTGLHPGAVADAPTHYGAPDALALFDLELDQPLGEQIDLSTITKVVLTHLHFDHAGSLALIPDSVPVFVQRDEWEAGKDAAVIERNFYLPRDYELIESQVTLVDGDHDLLGDSSVELLLTPGHTPGHQSVRVGDQLVIGGDVVHYASVLDDHRFPIIGDDLEAQAASAVRLRKLRDAGATVTPGHDPEIISPGV